MYKIGIISDIHANIDALNAVLLDMERKGVDKIVCLGDIVTKHIYPKEVVDAVRESCSVVVRGNCDDNVINNENFKFARSKLGMDRIEYLSQLPLSQQLIYEQLVLNFFHATKESNNVKYNPVDQKHVNEMLVGTTPQISFTGHTHTPYACQVSSNGLIFPGENTMIIDKDKTYILNPGSVGEPNIPNPDITDINKWLISENMNYILLTCDPKQTTAEIVNVPYSKILIKVYNDFINIQRPDQKGNRQYPSHPNTTRKIYDSLKNMGEENIVEPETIDIPKSR
ncbi:MAG: metallophosphoesterase family protein [Bacilli bacterium]|nr:metallophosphoesterase family protein [Bacilli bacterium]